MEKTDNFHDKSYKKLFSHPRMVEDLIKVFVRKDFVKDIDFNSLTELKQSYISDGYEEKEVDLIYKIKHKNGIAYFYILLEFQSTVDKYISLRMLTYILLFYQDLIKQSKSGKLPPVFPIMLYSGNEKWTAPDNLQELIDIPYKSMKTFIPSFKYFKIIENEFSIKSLKKLKKLE